MLIGILFLWAKENQDTQYKQGMNELLAIIVFAFFAERVETNKDFDKMSDEGICEEPEDLIALIFDSRHTFADIYTTFSRMLAFGVKNLYQETKDISILKQEMVSNRYLTSLVPRLWQTT